MGTWAVDSFGNDGANDWAYDLEKTKDLSLLQETLQIAANSGEEYLEAPQGEVIIAAAEVVAWLKGSPGLRNSYTEKIGEWVAANPLKPSEKLVSLAIGALNRVLREPSELLVLWEESADCEAWKSAVQELKQRLSR